MTKNEVEVTELTQIEKRLKPRIKEELERKKKTQKKLEKDQTLPSLTPDPEIQKTLRPADQVLLTNQAETDQTLLTEHGLILTRRKLIGMKSPEEEN